MKKLLAVSSLALLLVACSQHGKEEHHPHGKYHHQNLEVRKAIDDCYANMGEEKERATLHACLKEKGVEMPRDHHHGKGHSHHNPEFKKAAKACHDNLGKNMNAQQFESCMSEKGFKKPANHPKVMSK